MNPITDDGLVTLLRKEGTYWHVSFNQKCSSEKKDWGLLLIIKLGLLPHF